MIKFRIDWRDHLKNNSIYIYLFSLYPILFLYHQNIKEVAFGQVFRPMLFSVLITTILWLCLGFVFENKKKRAFVIFLILLVIFYYKLIHDVLNEITGSLIKPFARLAPHAFILIFLAYFIFLIRQSKHSFFYINKILNVTMFLLLAWNIGGILLFHFNNANIKNARSFINKSGFLKTSSARVKPDIYCFILDEFASLETIRDVFHYDNSQLAERLQRAGFFVAPKSRSLYMWTQEAIAAFLNMEKVPQKTDPNILIKRNKVTRFLKEQGYKIFDFPYDDLTVLADSEKHLFYPQEQASIFFNDFYKTLIEMSAFYLWAEKWQKNDNGYSLFSRKRVLYVFEQMPAFVKEPGPKFVLVHLFSPHAPFVFNKQGGAVAAEHSIDYSDRKYYLEQYLYISRRIAETAEMILKESATPPIIIFQSDHGYRGSFRKPLLHIVPDSEKRKIFLSVYLPGYPYKQLNANLSPVNVFRMILNHYFGQNLPELQYQE